MGRRLLIIDNEPHICESLKDRLEAMGYTVLVAHDGRTGLALMALEAKQAPIRGVLLDVEMPIMDGMEVLRELRSQHETVPVLMMSAGADHAVLRQAVRMGAKTYFLKPFDGNQFRRLCERFFPLDEDDV
ncbi:MAG TPA: response regulator [Nitrospira sp.]|nr:response regulator [Nitrospira sp.]